MPRIAFLLPNFHIGGAERVALTLIEALVDRGIDIDLVLLKAEGELIEALPAEVHLVSLDADRIRNAVLPFARYLRERRPDAVQVSMWPLTLVPLVARLLSSVPTRIVTSEHTVLSREYAERGVLHRLFLRASIGLVYPMADARVAVSEGVADDMAQLGRLKRQSIDVILNPVFLKRLSQAATPDWGGGGRRILTVGSLKGAKNHALLLEALARLDTDPDARLIILGEGALRPTLERKIEVLGIADRVSLPGSTLDPHPYYASADLFVLSSDYEGYPLVLVEAMLHGLRIVSTDCRSGPREILHDGKYGRLVSPGAADELAVAMREALDGTHEPEAIRRRAAALSQGTVDKYESLLMQNNIC